MVAPAQSPAVPKAKHRGRLKQWWLDRSVQAKALTVIAVPLIALFGTTSASLVLEHDERAATAQGVVKQHQVVDAAVTKVLADLAALRLAVSHGASASSLTSSLMQDQVDMDRLRDLTADLNRVPAAQLIAGRNSANNLESEILALDIVGLVLGVVAVVAGIAGIALFTSGISRRTADLTAARDQEVRATQAKNSIAPIESGDLSRSVDPVEELPSPDSESTEPLPTMRAARTAANLNELGAILDSLPAPAGSSTRPQPVPPQRGSPEDRVTSQDQPPEARL